MRELRAHVRAYAQDSGMAPGRRDDLVLAVSEIVGNAVMHAYRDGGDGVITVGAERIAGGVMIRVADDGMGLSPRPDSPGAGMGLMIAGTLADRMQIERPECGGTTVCMTFAAAA